MSGRLFALPLVGRQHGGYPIVRTTAVTDEQKVLGRPCDVVEAPDGAVLFTCDLKHRVYRLSHEKIDENKGH